MDVVGLMLLPSFWSFRSDEGPTEMATQSSVSSVIKRFTQGRKTTYSNHWKQIIAASNALQRGGLKVLFIQSSTFIPGHLFSLQWLTSEAFDIIHGYKSERKRERETGVQSMRGKNQFWCRPLTGSCFINTTALTIAEMPGNNRAIWILLILALVQASGPLVCSIRHYTQSR